MADDASKGDAPEVALDLDEQTTDLEAAMRDAVAAVEAGSSSGNPAAPGPAASEEVERLRREIADLKDRSVRTLADFDNFRKRSQRESQEFKKYALLEPMRDFLTVIDNLDLALSAQGSAEDLKLGVEMIHRQMQELLRRFGATEVPAVGQPFDPTLHEAVAREESPEVKAPTVVAELRRGYRMHDRLLRPSMVKVAVPVEEKPGPAASDDRSEEGPAL
ncbi:MAG TPA: nucleotide exchange factor GrpE [Thermoanaerobaculia bacterium]|nr:nucleotide exchange factor GrpE [Thermoanaerobaculia bacterium]